MRDRGGLRSILRSAVTRKGKDGDGLELQKPLRRRPFWMRRRQVRLVNQLSIADCGAACLAMVLDYYGRTTPLAECRELCGPGRDGITARTLADAARRFGLRVRAYSLEPAAFKYLALPAVAHWEFNHFVVVERWSAAGVQIADPAGGRRRLTAEEFSAGFTGVVLTLEPGAQFEVGRRGRKKVWRTYVRTLLSTRGVGSGLGQILLASVVLQVLGLALPILTKVVVDQVLPYRITRVMTLLGLGMLILVLAQTVIGYLRSLVLIYLRGRLDTQIMFGFCEHLLALPFSFFQQRTSGDLLMRLGSNSLIREMLTNQTVAVLLDGLFVVVYLALLATQAPSFGLVVLGLGLLQVLIVLGTRRRTRDVMQRDLATKAQEQSYLIEVMNGIAILKASGSEDRALDRWANLFFAQLNVSLERSQLAAATETAMGTVRALSPTLLLWFGAGEVLANRMSVGTMLALNALAAAFLAPLATLVGSGQQLQLAGAHLERIADVLEAEPEQSRLGKQPLSRLTGRLEVRGLTFRYGPNAPLVLSDVSFKVAPGQKVALVGPTGSGKSTLAMLLLGLFQASDGEILYDGIPLPALNYRQLRAQLGVVLQESFLFSGSIRENLTLSDPRISLDEVIEVARLAGVHDEIEQMPMGYETLLPEGGATLSGGQRQRLSIARALVNRPAVLILDEATSHLDVRTEARVDDNLSGLSCTRIVIAHRLSTMRNADQILVLTDGKIVERGRHDDLLRQAGPYAALVQAQLEKATPSTAGARGRPPRDASSARCGPLRL